MPTPIRYFLIKAPQPAKVRAVLADGKERVIAVNAGSRSKWADAEAALQGAVRAECLTRDGEVIRVLELELDDAEQVESKTYEPAAGASELVQVTNHIAKLLLEAGDRAAARHESAYRLGFDQQALLVKVLSERNAQLEKAWHKLLTTLDPKHDESGDINPDAIMGMVLQGVMQRQMGGGAPAATNGAATGRVGNEEETDG